MAKEEGNKGGTEQKNTWGMLQKAKAGEMADVRSNHICNYIKYKCTRYTGQRRKKIEHKLKSDTKLKSTKVQKLVLKN